MKNNTKLLLLIPVTVVSPFVGILVVYFLMYLLAWWFGYSGDFASFWSQPLTENVGFFLAKVFALFGAAVIQIPCSMFSDISEEDSYENR